MTSQKPNTPTAMWAVVFSVLVALVVGVLGYGVWMARARQATGVGRNLALPVRGMVVATEEIVEWFDGYGRANATETLRVVAEVTARVVERRGQDDLTRVAGQPYEPLVNSGQVLLRLDDKAYRDALTHAKGDRLADAARRGIEKCTLRSPLDGRIQRFNVDVGDRVTPGMVVCTIVDPATIEVPVQLPTLVFDHIRVGATCYLETASGSGDIWEGELSRIDPSTNRRARSFTVYVEVDNAMQSTPLLPGTSVRVRVSSPVHRDAIMLPRAACQGGRVFVAEDGFAKLRHVETERFINDRALVTGDLKTGDTVILSPLSHLFDGVSITVESYDNNH